MNEQEMRSEWNKIRLEISHNKPNIDGIYPTSIVSNRELLLLCQSLLGKIEAGINSKFNEKIFGIVMKHYHQQKQCSTI